MSVGSIGRSSSGHPVAAAAAVVDAIRDAAVVAVVAIVAVAAVAAVARWNGVGLSPHLALKSRRQFADSQRHRAFERRSLGKQKRKCMFLKVQQKHVNNDRNKSSSPTAISLETTTTTKTTATTTTRLS